MEVEVERLTGNKVERQTGQTATSYAGNIDDHVNR